MSLSGSVVVWASVSVTVVCVLSRNGLFYRNDFNTSLGILVFSLCGCGLLFHLRSFSVQVGTAFAPLGGRKRCSESQLLSALSAEFWKVKANASVRGRSTAVTPELQVLLFGCWSGFYLQ